MWRNVAAHEFQTRSPVCEQLRNALEAQIKHPQPNGPQYRLNIDEIFPGGRQHVVIHLVAVVRSLLRDEVGAHERTRRRAVYYVDAVLQSQVVECLNMTYGMDTLEKLNTTIQM